MLRSLAPLTVAGAVLGWSPRVAVGRDLLACDAEAHRVDANVAGALFGVEVTDPPDSPLEVVTAADAGAPFELPLEVVVSPIDGALYVVDEGTISPPRILVACPGPQRVLAADPRFVFPVNGVVTPGGVLLVGDGEADPSSLGPDAWGGGPGHGALFAVDVASGVVTVLSDGTSHDPLPGVTGPTAFEAPVGVAPDVARDVIYVADSQADPLGILAVGAVYAVRPSDGHVSLVATAVEWNDLLAIALRPDGSLVVIDSQGPGSDSAWNVDPLEPNPIAAVSWLSTESRAGQLADVVVAPDGTVFISDVGLRDGSGTGFVIPPRIWRIDETIPDRTANGVIVSSSTDRRGPWSLALASPCVPGSTPGGRLVINRGSALTMTEVRSQVAPGCRQPGFVVCPEQVVDGPLDGLVLPGEGLPAGTDAVWLYEHDEPVRTLRVSRVGSDLVFRAR